MSVTIVDVKERVSQEGNPFMALIVQNDLELVTSKSGNIYATAHRGSIPCTLDYDSAKIMIGKILPGKVEKQECDPYETSNSDGELIMLSHRYVYVAPESNKTEVDNVEFATEEVEMVDEVV